MKMNISAVKAKLFPKRTGSGNDAPSSEMDILDHIEKIVKISTKYGIDKCLPRGKAHFDYVAWKLGINPVQAVIFSHFMERSAEGEIRISEIADSIKCSIVRIIKYMNECNELEKKKLIRCIRGNGHILYRVPGEVRESLLKFNEYRPEKKENLTIDKFFTVLEKIFEERENNELTFETLTVELLEIINLNMHLLFCKRIMSYRFADKDLIPLIFFCHLYGNNSDDNIINYNIESLYDDKNEAKKIKRELSDGTHTLIINKFVVFNNSSGFYDTESWKLSDKAKKELLCELSIKNNYWKNLIQFDSIKPKKNVLQSKRNKSNSKTRFPSVGR